MDPSHGAGLECGDHDPGGQPIPCAWPPRIRLADRALARLVAPAGIAVPPNTPLPEILRQVQTLMQAGDPRAHRIYETIGTYLGYTVAHCAEFYEFRHLLILGRVTSGPGGEVILTEARQVLQTEFPDLASRVALHTPDEQDKRHGQAIAAASLPVVP